MALPCARRWIRSTDPIRNVIFDWSSTQVHAEILTIILSTYGYNVETVVADDSARYPGFEAGDLHIALETWKTTQEENFTKSVATGKVLDMGELGPQAKEDWWHPIYKKDQCPGLPAWEALKDCAEIFSAPDTAPKGRYLSGPVSWGGYDAERVETLDLPFVAVNAGTDASMFAELKSAFALREDGKSDTYIFGKNHEVSLSIDMGATVDSTGAGSGNQIWEVREDFILPVRCSKWSGAQVPQGGNDSLEDSLRVLSATLKLTEQTTGNGVCRVKTATALRANKAGATLKYRFVHSSGKKSPTFKIETEANKIAVINRTWDVPNEDGTESGWFQVEGVGMAFETAKVSYQMECSGKAPGGLSLGG